MNWFRTRKITGVARLVGFVLVTALLGGVTTIIVAWVAVYVFAPQLFPKWDEANKEADCCIAGISGFSLHVQREDVWPTITRVDFYRICDEPCREIVSIPDEMPCIPWWSYPCRYDSQRGVAPDCEEILEEVASGWPMTALYSTTVFDPDESLGTIWKSATVYGGIQASFLYNESTNHQFNFPLRPIWPGCLVDTLFFGTVWCFIILLPRHAKRRLRRWKGLCASCGYDVTSGELVACPECGWNSAK